MPWVAGERETTASRRLSLLRCRQLARYAIDCLGIEGVDRLSPNDRARLASVAAILREISEELKEPGDH
jgi:hypothetical protein